MRKIFISIAIFSGALAFAAPQQPVTAVSGASATAAKVVKYPAPAPAPVVYKTAQKVVFKHYTNALQIAIAKIVEAAAKCKGVDDAPAPAPATKQHRVNEPKQAPK